MEYLDFELRLDAGGEGLYDLAVDSPAGEAAGRLRLSLPELTPMEDRLAAENARNAEAQRSLVPRKQSAAEGGSAIELGRQLFEALLRDPEVRGCYRDSLQRASGEEKGLRLRLRINAPDLAVLPWEYLYDPRPEARCHLCLCEKTPVIRHLELEQQARPLTLEPPIRVLGMIGAHHGLDVDHEKKQMKEAVDHLVREGKLELDWTKGHTWGHLLKKLRQGPWHVFHFIGHGDFDAEAGQGLLLLEGEDGGPSYRLMARELADLLAGHPSLRLVVLNSCKGARASRDDLFSSTATVLAGREIPAVVSMQFEITDRAALVFAYWFYDSLAQAMAVDAALTEARQAISMELKPTVEWGTPVLHMRSPDGRLFKVDLAGAIFRQAPPAPSVPPAGSRRPAAGTAAARGLGILRNRVREFWIDGVLERSIHRDARLELGMEMREDAVESLLETPGAGSEPLPPGQTLGQVLEEVGGSVLVLGEPGSGKTTTLLELAGELLDDSEGDPGGQAVPVVFNLSTWDGAGGSLSEWLAGELSAKYLIPKKVGRTWLGGRRILPLLDGLDEVGPERRRADCVKAINGFAAEALTGIVVCCRTREYLKLKVRLALNGAIRLQPLARDQVLAFVARAGEQLAALRALLERLERDSGMLIEARSPLMLSLMVQAYRGLPPEEVLAGEHPEGVAQRRKWLMDAYVAAMFRRAQTGVYHD